MRYITEMPSEGASHSRGHKYPYLCSEILNSEISAVVDAFFVPTIQKPEKSDEPKSLTSKSLEAVEREPINDPNPEENKSNPNEHQDSVIVSEMSEYAPGTMKEP